MTQCKEMTHHNSCIYFFQLAWVENPKVIFLPLLNTYFLPASILHAGLPREGDHGLRMMWSKPR